MLDIVFGSSGQSPQEEILRETLQALNLTGTLYFSYPIFSGVEGQKSADALLVTEAHGLVLFDLTAPASNGNYDEWLEIIDERQTEIYRNIVAKLLDNKDLVKRKELVVKPAIVTLCPDLPAEYDEDDDLLICTPENLGEAIYDGEQVPTNFLRAINATIERVATIKPRKKRGNVAKADSLGAKLKTIEKEIANLDSWQKRSAISYPEGPQRIRGLAGSGKTIVLALKAAHLHASHPDWDIVVTYYSASLEQQFKDLVRRFMYETKKDEPDWTKIHIMHCWGGRYSSGLYSEIANDFDVPTMSWGDAQRKYGDHSFQGACQELLASIAVAEKREPKYDAILIDEAQDLPAEFFQLAYEVCKEPKRIVWAYDELQNLGSYSMPSTAELFGSDAQGTPKVVLKDEVNRPPQDIVLPICYRNTPWALTTAHGLGFGVYRKSKSKDASHLVQIFDEPKLWEDIGYEAMKGNLALGQRAILRRKPDCSPSFYRDVEQSVVKPEDAIGFFSFDDTDQQAGWIAQQIKQNIETDELLPSDILIILPDAYTSKSQYAILFKALSRLDIASHLVGVTAQREKVFNENSIAVTHIHRAKGNEAPMVYFVNADSCYDGLELAKKRNTLFTAITRSKAWVRVCGVGERSQALQAEFSRIRDANYILDFTYPSADQIKSLRKIHRDRSDEEREELVEKFSAADELIRAINTGDISVDALPPELIQEIYKLKGGSEN